MSHLPHGTDTRQAAEAVRALDPRYARVVALDSSGSVDVLTQHEGKGATARGSTQRDEEAAYEGLLLGMEVPYDVYDERGEFQVLRRFLP